MTKAQQKAALEAILFAAAEPLTLDKLAQALELSQEETQPLLESLLQKYNKESSGIQIVRLADAYQMCSNRAFAPQVRRALEIRKNTPLSPAALEVLAIIAYNQPVTKAFLEQVRGVDCAAAVTGLMHKGLVEERGRLELPGRPLLYGTTQNFLRCMGIASLTELPPLPDTEPAAEAALDFAEELGEETQEA